MTAQSELRSFVERIQRLEAEIAELNSDKRDVYTEAKSKGFDVPALKAVIAYLRKDPAEAEERRTIFDLYLAQAQGAHEPAQPKKRASGLPKPIARPSSEALARVHETEPAVIMAQPTVLPAVDGETWPVESTWTPGPSLEADVTTDNGGSEEDNGASDPLIEAAPPTRDGGVSSDAAMPVGHGQLIPNDLSIPEFLRR